MNKGICLVLVMCGFAGCAKTTAPELPRSAGVVKVAMREFGYEYNKTVPRGRVIFRVHNAGRMQHDLVMWKLPEDLPPLDTQLRSNVRRGVETVRLLPVFDPGDTTSFAADLEPGRYGFVCFIPDTNGATHALRGMNSEFRIK